MAPPRNLPADLLIKGGEERGPHPLIGTPAKMLGRPRRHGKEKNAALEKVRPEVTVVHHQEGDLVLAAKGQDLLGVRGVISPEQIIQAGAQLLPVAPAPGGGPVP